MQINESKKKIIEPKNLYDNNYKICITHIVIQSRQTTKEKVKEENRNKNNYFDFQNLKSKKKKNRRKIQYLYDKCFKS